MKKCTDVGGANCCSEMIHIASLSGRATCANFTFPIAGIKGGRDHLVPYIQYGPAYAMCIRACVLNVLMLEGLTAVPK